MLFSENIKLTGKGLVFFDKDGNQLSTKAGLNKIFRRILNWVSDLDLLIVNRSGWCPIWSWRKLIYQAAGLKIGRKSKIHVFCRFFEPKNIEIGEGSVIGEGGFLDGRAKLTIGNHTDIASQVLIYNSKHDVNDPGFKAVERPVEIGNYVFIGPRAIIMPGVKIGRGAVIAAGAIVTKNVPEGEIFAGIPARKIGQRKLKEFKYHLGRTRLFQ